MKVLFVTLICVFLVACSSQEAKRKENTRIFDEMSDVQEPHYIKYFSGDPEQKYWAMKEVVRILEKYSEDTSLSLNSGYFSPSARAS